MRNAAASRAEISKALKAVRIKIDPVFRPLILMSEEQHRVVVR
jgi:hypothetical protein